MKKAEKFALIVEYDEELKKQDVTNRKKGILQGSTAHHAKFADFAVRDYLLAHGVENKNDIVCRPGSKHDWDLFVNRQRIVGETKVGTGAVRYAKTREELSYDPDEIYPDVDFIAYCAEADRLKKHPEARGELFRVFTREQFIVMLTETGKKGLESSLRIHQSTSGTWQLEIVAWKTKQTAARLGKYEDWIEDNEIPTLEEFREIIRG